MKSNDCADIVTDRRLLRRIAQVVYLAVASSIAAPNGAAQTSHDPVILASDAELAASRGGFVLDSGTVINISIDRRVYQNGVETFSSYFESPQELAALRPNSADIGAEFVDSLLNSIIQNTRDNQLIETISKIDIELRNPAAITQDVTGAAIFSQFLEPGLR